MWSRVLNPLGGGPTPQPRSPPCHPWNWGGLSLGGGRTRTPETTRTGIWGRTSNEGPRSSLLRSPFWPSWLPFRQWRKDGVSGYLTSKPGGVHGDSREEAGRLREDGHGVREPAGGQVGCAGDPAAGVRAAAEAAGERGEPAAQQELLDPAAAPGQQGGGPQGAGAPEDAALYFSEPRGRAPENRQEELCTGAVKGNHEALRSPGCAATKPELLTATEKGEEAGSHGLPSADGGQHPAELWLVSKEKSLEEESKAQEPAWEAEGGPGKEGLEGLPVGICLLSPGEKWLPSLQAPRTWLWAWGSAHPAPSVARALAGRSTVSPSPVPTVPKASHSGPRLPAIAMRTYACSQCGKSFVHQSILAAHNHTHTSEKPFQCSQRGKCFVWKPSFTWHLRGHRRRRAIPAASVARASPVPPGLCSTRAATPASQPPHLMRCVRGLPRWGARPPPQGCNVGKAPQ
nr:zinc finger protein 629-like [Microcebus murinus]